MLTEIMIDEMVKLSKEDSIQAWNAEDIYGHIISVHGVRVEAKANYDSINNIIIESRLKYRDTPITEWVQDDHEGSVWENIFEIIRDDGDDYVDPYDYYGVCQSDFI